jgi:hypothetical protein
MVEKRSPQRQIVLAALFTAIGVAVGRLMAGVPNVELVTLSVFIGGVFCGMRAGAAIGALVMLVHSLLNPLGPPPPPLLPAQMAGFALAGFAGGLLGRRSRLAGARGAVAAAAAGFAVTLVYDALTTIATAFVVLGARGFAQGIWGIAAAGLLFTAIHVGVNTALFAAAVPSVVAAGRAVGAGGAA